MAHQCVHCKKIIPLGSKELLTGCGNCGGKFFFYIKDEYLEKIIRNPVEIPEKERGQIEKDIRDLAGIEDSEIPIILDIESIRVTGSGKYEIDLPNLFNKKRPLLYKLEEGKYIIDLSSTIDRSVKDLREIKDPYGEEEKL